MKLRRLLFVVLFAAPLFGQVSYQDGSAIGFGFTSPRLFGDAFSEYFDVGGHVFFVREFDEVNSFRLKVEYLTFTSRQDGLFKPKTTNIGVHLDYLYKFTPCSPMKSYLGTGIGLISYKVDDSRDAKKDNWYMGELGFTFLIGSQYSISPEWDLRAEFSHTTVSTDRFDGKFGDQGGLFGGVLDSYVSLEVGAVYYFSRGPKTEYCEAPGGMTKNFYTTGAAVDYDKIKKMIDAAQPKQAPVEIDYAKIESMIDKKLSKLPVPEVKAAPIMTATGGEIALVGINFDNNSSVIRSENYSILAQAAQTLLSYPNLKVEIQGYTDAKGSEKGNAKLSDRRATAVKNYLVAKGVDAGRLTMVGYGEKKPVSDNASAEGRALNRRVEFKIIK